MYTLKGLCAVIETLPASKFRESTRLSFAHDTFRSFSFGFLSASAAPPLSATATASSSVIFFPSASAPDIFTLTLHLLLDIQVVFLCFSFYRHTSQIFITSYSLIL